MDEHDKDGTRKIFSHPAWFLWGQVLLKTDPFFLSPRNNNDTMGTGVGVKESDSEAQSREDNSREIES